MAPLPSLLPKELCTVGPLRSTGVTPSPLLQTRPPPSRLSTDFPGDPVMRPTLLHRFLDGTRTASPVARHVLVTVLPLLPRRSGTTHRSGFVVSCCLRPIGEGSASGICILTRPPTDSLALRPGDLLTIPWIALSIGFTGFVSSTGAIQATRSLILTSVGLSPTEHASLRWTHSYPENRPPTFARDSRHRSG